MRHKSKRRRIIMKLSALAGVAIFIASVWILASRQSNPLDQNSPSPTGTAHQDGVPQNSLAPQVTPTVRVPASLMRPPVEERAGLPVASPPSWSPRSLNRLTVEVKSSRENYASARLLWDGVRVDLAELRYTKGRDGQWRLRSGAWPSEPPQLPENFPKFVERDLKEWIQSKLNEELAGRELQVAFKDRSWKLTASGLLPCAQFRVDIREVSRSHSTELWCVEPTSREILSRSSARKH